MDITEEYLSGLVAVAGGVGPCMLAVQELHKAKKIFSSLQDFTDAVAEEVMKRFSLLLVPQNQFIGCADLIFPGACLRCDLCHVR